jgi:hypothetical protein
MRQHGSTMDGECCRIGRSSRIKAVLPQTPSNERDVFSKFLAASPTLIDPASRFLPYPADSRLSRIMRQPVCYEA